MTSIWMLAPHLALTASPDRYLGAKLPRHRRCGVFWHMMHSLSRQPKLLSAGQEISQIRGSQHQCKEYPSLGIGMAESCHRQPTEHQHQNPYLGFGRMLLDDRVFANGPQPLPAFFKSCLFVCLVGSQQLFTWWEELTSRCAGRRASGSWSLCCCPALLASPAQPASLGRLPGPHLMRHTAAWQRTAR